MTLFVSKSNCRYSKGSASFHASFFFGLSAHHFRWHGSWFCYNKRRWCSQAVNPRSATFASCAIHAMRMMLSAGMRIYHLLAVVGTSVRSSCCGVPLCLSSSPSRKHTLWCSELRWRSALAGTDLWVKPARQLFGWIICTSDDADPNLL